MAEDTPTSTSKTLHTHPRVTCTGYTTQGGHTHTLETRSQGGHSSEGTDYPGLLHDSLVDALDDPAAALGDGPPQVVAFQLKRMRSDDGSSTAAEEACESLEQDSSGYVSCSEGFPTGGGASDAEPEFPAGSRSLRSIREDLASAVSRETRPECHDAFPLATERETCEVGEVIAGDGSRSEKASIAEGKLATTSFTTKNAGAAKGEGSPLGREGEARQELGASGRTESSPSDARRETVPSSRPPLTRARPLFGDDDPETPSALAPHAEDLAVRPKSAEKKSIEREDSSSSIKSRRNRKKGYASSSSLSLENPLPEIAEDPPAPHHVVLDLTDDSEHVPFVAVAVEEPKDPDSWDHEEDLSMKIQTDLESQGDSMASRYIKSKGIRVPPPRHRSFGETVVNISGSEVDSDYVIENENRKVNNSFNQGDLGEAGDGGGAEYLGHENYAFVEDEQDTISQEENFTSPDEQVASHVELPRRSSDPEVSASAKSDEVKVEEELFRSASCGTELDKVLNNLSGEQSPATGTPTLRKRSISRGRQESIHSETDDGKTKEETPDSAKYGDKKVRLRPTFFLGGEENNPNIFNRLVRNSPPIRLKRSESTKSHMSPMAYKEEGLSRSTSNIWEGGTRTRGGSGSSGGGGHSSHHSRLPNTPTSPSVSVKGERRSEKGYLLQQHLYRNSRRNVQQKLHRQLSDSHYHDDSSRYSDHHKHDHHHHHHKKHDSHSLSDLSHQSLPIRLQSLRDSSPSRHSQHSHGHHHRSQSQRHHHKPRHELLRRHNTYGHEQYHKYVQEHEQRYALEHPYEQEQTQDQDTLQVQEDIPERRLSHYRQEEKGKTDVER
ncbi:protein split ends-like [Penaeus japonicus]|uniref:protein split ends-like n=1 Tax=Penaeus japonicus TaxID=27405 RepID=UPI001C71586B|nr:protein split ends-like [Penaeus japonicus]XP_042887528.1 protein split ends-like [Penaeus japonicus]